MNFIMDRSPAELEGVGLVVTDLSDEAAYADRPLRARNSLLQLEGLQRLASALVESPESILQELAEAAVRICGADSAGVSIEREDKTDADYYQWVATAGVYSSFLNASLPIYPSACTVCLTRGTPQLFQVHKRFFDILGVEAAIVKDGILLPWEADDMRGTIFVISHSREQAFDIEDLRLMQIFRNFAAMGVRQQRQQRKLMEQTRIAGGIAMANELAHQINNPLQSLMNTLYLAKQSSGVGDERSLATKLEDDFSRLSFLAKRLLELPRKSSEG
jgi:hypothetical protein